MQHHINYIKGCKDCELASKPASIKIQFLFSIIRIIVIMRLDIVFSSFLLLSFSFRDITPIFAELVVLKRKKGGIERAPSSRPERSETIYFTFS
jgi:hypothetical protein